jgi:hypothetical protein
MPEEVVKEEKEWTADLIRRQFVESPDSIKAFERVLADHQDTFLTTSEVAKILGTVSKSIAGALGAYGRRTSNRYEMKTWPFETRWVHDEGQMSYCMKPEVAEIIKSL